MKSNKSVERGTAEEMAQMTGIHMRDDVTSKKSVCPISAQSRVHAVVIALLSFLLLTSLVILVVVLSLRQSCSTSSTGSENGSNPNGAEAVVSNNNATAKLVTISPIATTQFPWLTSLPGKQLLRLPETILPVSYNIDLVIDVERADFNGSVTILLQVEKDTSYIVLHSHSLAIKWTSVNVRHALTNREVGIREQNLVPMFDFYFIELEHALYAGSKYHLSIGQFHGQLLEDLKGLYRSMYKTETGANKVDSKRYLVASQLQATDARRVFPCFDEPDMKATFSVSITHAATLRALSNMPVIKSEYVYDGWVKDVFATTPVMSTYLLAFVVSDFPCRNTSTKLNMTISICSRPQVFHQTKYALNFTEKIYEYFTDYFNISEIVPKADHVAIPDFSAGAMENWGLVLYRETSLLYDEIEGSVMVKFWVSLVMAHEIAHTWFGNMVTMKWWDDLWLNEGFGNTLMYFAIDHVYPQWKAFDLQLINNIHPVMTKDSLLSSHPVSAVINNPDDIGQLFDHISYDKGMAVLRMLFGFMVNDDFRKGLQLFVKRYQMKNAEASELWSTFAEVINNRLDIATIMNSWTKQTGLPVVHVRQLSPGIYQLDQERFLLNPEDKFNRSSSPYGYKWYIPFSYRTQSSTQTRFVWMNFSSAQIHVPANMWVLGNIGRYGFFRTNYEDQMWQQLANQLLSDHTVFSVADRAGLISDAFSLARANKVGYDTALKIASYLSKETEFVPWESFFDSMDYIQTMLSETDVFGLLKKYIISLIFPQYNRLRIVWWQESTMLDRLLKKAILKEVINLDVKDSLVWMKTLFDAWMYNGTRVPSDIASIVYAVGIKEGDENVWDYVLKQSRLTRTVSDAEILMSALCHTRQTWLLWRFARWSLDSYTIRTQDVRNHFRYLTVSPLGRLVAFQFLLTNWQELNKRFGSDTFLLRDVIQSVGTQLNTEFEYEQLRRLYEERPPAGLASKAAENSLAIIRNFALGVLYRTNINWMKTHYSVIEKWLQTNV